MGDALRIRKRLHSTHRHITGLGQYRDPDPSHQSWTETTTPISTRPGFLWRDHVNPFDMDLLCSAYPNAPEEDEAEKLTISSSKRLRLDSTSSRVNLLAESASKSVPDAPVSGRYVSKRERAMSASRVFDSTHTSCSSTIVPSPALGSISDSDLPSNILSSLKRHTKGRVQLSRIPQRLAVPLNSQTKAVNAIQWSPTHAHLLASAGMDQTVCIWNVWSRGNKKARVFNNHNAAIKDVRWSYQGLSLLSCGYDMSSRLIDVETGTETQHFREDQVVSTIRFHPNNSSLFLSGGSKGSLRLWDVRLGKVVREYLRDLGPILDIEFSVDAKHFISSSDVSKSNLSENAIIVWDVLRQVPLSNQVYAEAYTCPCIRYHPFESSFVAQSNGNYIAIFSTRPPFKLDRYKRYEKHVVSGFPIKCNFSLDGEKLASGSSDGCICFYSYRSSELLKKIKVYEQACIDVAFHPILPNVLASCSWNGDVSIFE